LGNFFIKAERENRLTKKQNRSEEKKENKNEKFTGFDHYLIVTFAILGKDEKARENI
jgi:hypothetical protein